MSTLTVPTTNPSGDADSSAVALDELVSVLGYLREVTERHKHYAELRKSAEAMVKTALGDAEIGTVDGESVVTYKKTFRISVSHKKLVEAHPDIARECEDITEIRTFRLVD